MADYPADAVRLVPSARQCTVCGAMVLDEDRFAEHYAAKHADEEPDGEE